MSDLLSKAKIASKDTGIEIRQTFCGICCANMYCGVDAYVKDDVIIKVEGTPDHVQNKGKLCVKGYALRDYVYNERRLKTPMRRIGKRGEGLFEPISWEEAYREIAEKTNLIKNQYGARAMTFFCGYEKWYRPMLQRLANAFGTPNYGTESSTCATSTKMASFLNSGTQSSPDLKNCKSYLGFAFNQYYSRFAEGLEVEELRKRGVKFITIDPRDTPTSSRLSDLHLKLYPGTDGALAHGLANLFIQNDWVDHDYIEAHVHGYEEYVDYVSQFTPDYTSEITGLPSDKIIEAAQILHDNMPFAIHETVSPLVHHTNGMQNYRAILALSAIAGCYDRKGGNVPRVLTYANQGVGFATRDLAFRAEGIKAPLGPAIGADKYPLWAKMVNEAQMVEFPRQVLEGKPYPVKGLISFGQNIRMMPQPDDMIEAIQSLDFFCAIDLFNTETVSYADIVLPACTSVERDEFKIYRGGYAHYTKRAIEPLYESRSDVQIISEMAKALEVEDELLYAGYEACVRDIISPLSVTVEELQASRLPILVPEANQYQAGTATREGYKTPTKKYELWSTVLDAFDPSLGYDPLPTYRDSRGSSDPQSYPYLLFTGSSLPYALHSRSNYVAALRQFRPDPAADINPRDASKLGVIQGDKIALYTSAGEIVVKAHLTESVKEGTVSMYHGYQEADVNTIIPATHTDPYCGFPGFKSLRCGVKKVGNQHG